MIIPNITIIKLYNFVSFELLYKQYVHISNTIVLQVPYISKIERYWLKFNIISVIYKKCSVLIEKFYNYLILLAFRPGIERESDFTTKNSKLYDTDLYKLLIVQLPNKAIILKICLFAYRSVSGRWKWYEMENSISINNNISYFKIDTGASVNVISMKTFIHLEIKSEIKPSTLTLYNVCEQVIPLI